MTRLRYGAVAAVLAAATAGVGPAVAHVVLETREAAVGSYYKAVFEVPHGCAGSATTAIRVQIPEGVIGVKPMPKPGWTLTMSKAAYTGNYRLHGKTLSEGVKEVAWSGGHLSDDNYDEFVMMAFVTDGLKPGAMLYFPVVQECEHGVSRWIDIPADGAAEPKTPAPGVRLKPKS